MVVAMTKDQGTSAGPEGIAPNQVAVRLHGYHLCLPVAPDEQVMFYHGMAIAGRRIERIAYGNELQGLITMPVALGNIAKQVVVDMVPFTLLRHDGLHQLATSFRPVNGLFLKQIMVHLDLGTAGTDPHPFRGF